jgi:hypothetical protein
VLQVHWQSQTRNDARARFSYTGRRSTTFCPLVSTHALLSHGPWQDEPMSAARVLKPQNIQKARTTTIGQARSVHWLESKPKYRANASILAGNSNLEIMGFQSINPAHALSLDSTLAPERYMQRDRATEVTALQLMDLLLRMLLRS